MTAAEAAGGTPTNDASNERTEVIYGIDNIIERAIEGFSIIRKTEDSVFASNGLSAFLPIKVLKNQYHILKKRGVNIRFITEITKEDIPYCKEAMEFAEIRHLDGIKGNFGVHDGIEYTGTAILEKTGSPTQRLIYSNLKEIVVQHQYLFETLWNKAIPAEQKIKEIEQGIKPEIMKTIKDPLKIQNQYVDLLKLATDEIMLIVPTTNMLKHHNKIGILQLIKESAITNKNLHIKVLTPLNKDSNGELEEKSIFSLSSLSPYIQAKNIEETGPITTATAISIIIIIDRKESLVIEVKDDSKDTFVKAIGFATYSNSMPTVLSYISIFESFWLQTELYKKVQETEQMQKDFINIAAHELKSPIQPILGLTRILKDRATDKDQLELQDVVYRNAIKLKQLTEDILDLAKIESRTLELNKEYFNLNELIQNIIDDLKEQLCKEEDNQSMKLELVSNEEQIYINADKGRINQVISNLLNNAIRFTAKKERGDDEGKIITTIKRKDNLVFITIKDNGQGISPEILPRLFTKFVTKSETGGGTGLGLFISKSIVEVHGGGIWAKNNENGNGATFSFSLPLVNQ